MNNSTCAVLITYNRLDCLKDALSHILNQDEPPACTIIINNNSTDGTREYLDSIANDPALRVVHLESNVGSAGGIDIGMKMGLEMPDIEYFWVLDDDTLYRPEVLGSLTAAMKESDFSMIGLTGYQIRRGKKIKPSEGKKLQEVDYTLIDGALIRASAVKKIGTVSPEFFMMCDDHEYCMRMKKNGLKVGLLDIGEIERLFLGGDGSFTKATLWRGYYSARNMMYIVKHYYTFSTMYAYMVRQSKLLVAAALFAPDRFTRVKFRLMGIWHGLIGVGGKTLDPSTLKFSKGN